MLNCQAQYVQKRSYLKQQNVIPELQAALEGMASFINIPTALKKGLKTITRLWRIKSLSWQHIITQKIKPLPFKENIICINRFLAGLP